MHDSSGEVDRLKIASKLDEWETGLALMLKTPLATSGTRLSDLDIVTAIILSLKLLK